jgi:hypothetical protein
MERHSTIVPEDGPGTRQEKVLQLGLCASDPVHLLLAQRMLSQMPAEANRGAKGRRKAAWFGAGTHEKASSGVTSSNWEGNKKQSQQMTAEQDEGMSSFQHGGTFAVPSRSFGTPAGARRSMARVQCVVPAL